MIRYDGGSFKDPAGRVFHSDGFAYRRLSPMARETFEGARESGLLDSLEDDELMVRTELVSASAVALPETEVGRVLLRQIHLPFVSYAYEWSFEMLRDAALTTLRIVDRSLASGYILKDANSFNILFDDNVPKLVDVPSLEPYREGQIWVGYGQFCRSFLFPLLIAAYRDLDFRPLLRGTLGEVTVHETERLLRPRDYLRRGVMRDVLAQAHLERRFGRTSGDVKTAATRARYPKAILAANVRRLQAIIEQLKAPAAVTEWTDYEAFHSYTETDRSAKHAFVRDVITSGGFSRIVDLGCNAGEYCQIALDCGAHVIGVDVDALAIDRLYRRVGPGARLSPVVASLLNPTPAMGWGLRERQPLLERLRADCFFALALIHHLRITGGIPLDLILDGLLAMAPEGVIEWIDKEDAMVTQMLSLRSDVYDDYTWPHFESLLRERGELVSVRTSHGGQRRLCHVRRRTPPVAREPT